MRFAAPDAAMDVDTVHPVIAGWTGREEAAVIHPITGLAGIGSIPPSQVPLFCRVSADLLVQILTIEVLGATTSGEVEPLLVSAGSTPWLGLGSDQSGRAPERMSVAAPKQACPKPVSGRLLPLDDVAGHLDDLTLRCHSQEDGNRVLYPERVSAAILPVPDLAQRAGIGDNSVMLRGTLGAIGPVRRAQACRMELIDQTLKRSLSLEYWFQCLPVVQ